MRILSKIVFTSLVATLPFAMTACGDGDNGDNGDGGNAGDSSTGGGNNGTGGGNNGSGGTGNGGATGECGTDVMFDIDACAATDGPTDAVKCFNGAGAFVDESDWMDGWTNWSVDSTPEDDGSDADGVLATCTAANSPCDIAKGIYTIAEPTYVEDGATMNIAAGTIIRGSAGATVGSLIVQNGGTLNAVGTVDEPIIFTSSAANGSKVAGGWGGVIVLGDAMNWDGSILIEGVEDDPANYHGGDADDDSSGEMKYVRIEFGGVEIGEGNEINGLTLGSVGSGTDIAYVQVNTTLDDGFEWFGGNVDMHHLVVNNAGDDMFDGDKGFRGDLDYLFGRQVTPLTSDPCGFEMDGDDEDTKTNDVNTTINTSNVTLCGTGTPGLNITYGAVLRENLEGSHDSLIALGFDAGFDPRDQAGTNADPQIAITGSISGDHFDGVGYDETDLDCSGSEPQLCDDDNEFSEIDWFRDGAGNEDLDE